MNANLHAFPDHQVMQACLEGIHDRRRTRGEAANAIRNDPGWIPVAIEPAEMLIYFVNVGQRDLDRWQFVYSIEAIASEDSRLDSFSVPFGILEDLDLDG